MCANRRGGRARWPPWSLTIAGVAGLWLGGAAGCSRNDQVTGGGGGGPVLLTMFWAGRHQSDGHAVVWSADTAADLARVVTPSPFEFELVFDRRLDGDKIEDTVVQGGVAYTVPKAMPPVTVTWDGMPAGLGPLTVAYNSLALPDAPSESTYVFGRADTGYPSATALTFHLDAAMLTGTDNRPMLGPDAIAVTTAPFSMQILGPAGTDGGATPAVPADFRFPLAFNSQPAKSDAVTPYISLSIDGAPAAFGLVTADQDATTLYVSPPRLGQTWPAGAQIALSVKAGLPDVFGVPLGAGADATFVIAGTRADGGTDAGAGAPD